MKPFKFSPGDDFIVVNREGVQPYENGDKGKIIGPDSFSMLIGITDPPIYEVMMENGKKSWIFEDEIEHAAIVNSPLWKALK